MITFPGGARRGPCPVAPGSARAGALGWAALAALAGFAVASSWRAPAADPAPDLAPAPNAPPAKGLDEIRILIDLGRYAEAEGSARRRLATAESLSGPRSSDVADVLDLLVESLYEGGKRTAPGTLELAERAVHIREDPAGGSPAALGRSLYNLGGIIYAHLDLARTRSVLERSLDIRRRALGREHPDVAESLWLLGELHMDLGEDDLARDRLARALAIREQALGSDHLDVAESLHSLGKFHHLRGDFVQARSLTGRALVIRERKLGTEHPLVTKTLHNLAGLEQIEGNYSRARDLHERALRSQIKALGPEHPLVGASYLALGSILHSMGEFSVARGIYRRALDILERRAGPKHPQFANTLASYAQLLQDCGDFEEAKRLEERVLAIRREIHPRSHHAIASSLSQLGYLQLSLGDTAGARAHLEEALAIAEETLEPGHPGRFHSLLGLAWLSVSAGDLAEALRLCDRAFDSARSAFESTNPQFASLLLFRGALLVRSGDIEGARRCYRDALAIADQLPGTKSLLMAEIREGEARALAGRGESKAALEAALAAETAVRTQVAETARTLSERQALAYAARMRDRMDLVLSILEASSEPSPGGQPEAKRAVWPVWNAVVRSRGLVLDEMASRHATIREEQRADVEQLAEAHRSARQRLANLLVRGSRDLPPGHYARLVDEARRESERAEEDLAARSAEFRQAQERRAIGLDEVLAHLPAGSALVAFTRFDRDSFLRQGGAATKARRDDTLAYAAFVAAPGRAGPVWIPLGGAEIDSLVAAWRAELAVEGRPSISPAAEAACRRAGTAVRARIWDRVSPHLAHARRVFVVPDGSLNRITFAALPVGDDRYLVETGPVIHLLSAERDLISQPERDSRASGLLALGGVDFDQRALDDDRLAGTGEAPGGVIYRGPRPDCEHLDSIAFETLPASEQEIDEVIRIWGDPERKAQRKRAARVRGAERLEVVRLTGADASEAALKRRAAGKAILHLATHGIFLDGRCTSGLQGRRGIGGVAPLAIGGAAPLPALAPARGNNPLLLCGLALAGANRRDATEPWGDDGILTAEEIATLGLAGLEWAVLSACNTGLGEIRAGEGILGLRRAFQVAGARTLIMSLWSVEDEAARAWMRRLYQGRFGEGLDTAEAVRLATLASLTARRERGETTHPFFWAGFVASGDWR